MAFRNTNHSYGSVAKTFHWLIALLILTMIPLGIVASDMAHNIKAATTPVTEAFVACTAFLFSLHKTLGVAVFFIALARIAWAVTQPKPVLLKAERRLESYAAETVHWLLYGSLLLVPLTGWIHHAATTGFAPIWWPFGQSLPFVPKDPQVAETFAGLHIVFERVLAASLILHVAGALKHHFIDHDVTLRRMLPGRVDLPQPPGTKQTAAPFFAAMMMWGAALGVGSAIGLYGAPVADAARTELDAVQSDWLVENGTLELSVTQIGDTVSGSFADWTASISFEEPETSGLAGSVEVTVAVGSLMLGSVTAQAKGPDFFDATDFPTATFAGQIVKTETGYEATGPLTIKGITIPITLPFDLTITGDTAEMTGTVRLNRLDFGIGTSMPDESSLAFAVDVSVSVTATRVSPAS